MDLKTNEYYSLSKLFSTGNRKIIIPDFQRDYCWADKTHGENNDTDIVSNFLDTLIEEFQNAKDSDVLLGKIDVYEHPKDHIYLTDGQQRLTTLFLLIGMLLKREKSDALKSDLKKCLVSDFEDEQDDKEPYLQYSVRESTVFFMRDLVNDFFIKDNSLKISNIQSQSWYFKEYDLDPSIQSILSALSKIESKEKEMNDGFAEFVINRIKIQYYDVQDKKHGEERFVIINTTGKSLTVSENIKPILLGNVGNSDYSKQWEERETWFWKNRDNEKEFIADNGVNDFLNWCFQIIDRQDEIDIIRKAKQLLKEKTNQIYLQQIQNYYTSLLILIEYLKDDRFIKQFQFINDNNSVKTIVDLRKLSREKQQNVVLPLIAFISKFKGEVTATYQFLRRLRKNYFDLIWKDDIKSKDRKKNHVDWRYILKIIELSKCLDEVLQFETNEDSIEIIQNVKLNNWFNEEEKTKQQLTEHKSLLEEWEDHLDFMGDLTFLFQSYKIKVDDAELPHSIAGIDIEIERLKSIFFNYQSTVDLIRNYENAKDNIQLANMFRLFRLFIGCNKVGHIYRASWDFKGVLFSTLNREHLYKVEFMKLLKSENLLDHCSYYVRESVTENNIFNLSDFSSDKFIKAWLTLKVFHANMNNVLLAFYDGNETGVAAYENKDLNRLLDSVEFSLSNSICGFGVRSGFGGGNKVHYTGSGNWLKPNIIDTPFDGVDFESQKRTISQIEINKKEIDEILDLIIL